MKGLTAEVKWSRLWIRKHLIHATLGGFRLNGSLNGSLDCEMPVLYGKTFNELTPFFLLLGNLSRLVICNNINHWQV
jgi:hypothetical protein